jgi:hypothetical protein
MRDRIEVFGQISINYVSIARASFREAKKVALLRWHDIVATLLQPSGQ